MSENQYEHKDGKGSAWPLENPSSERSPHFTGSFKTPDGHLLRVSIWKEKTKSGKPYLSLAIQEPQSNGSKPKPQSQDDPFGDW